MSLGKRAAPGCMLLERMGTHSYSPWAQAARSAPRRATCLSPPGSALPSLGWVGEGPWPLPCAPFLRPPAMPLPLEAAVCPTGAAKPSLRFLRCPQAPPLHVPGEVCAPVGAFSLETPLVLPPVPPLSSESPPKRPGSQAWITAPAAPGSSETQPRGAIIQTSPEGMWPLPAVVPSLTP